MPCAHPRRRTERGSVTAETAVVLPALLVLLAAVLWALAAAAGHLRCVDAARAAARELARGESAASARHAAGQVAPTGALVSIHTVDGLIRVDVSTTVHPFGPVLSRLPGLAVRGDATAFPEEAVTSRLPEEAGTSRLPVPDEAPDPAWVRPDPAPAAAPGPARMDP